MFPKIVLGIFERMSIFSAVVFNAVLGGYLFAGRFVYERKNIIEKERLFLREMTEKDYDDGHNINRGLREEEREERRRNHN